MVALSGDKSIKTLFSSRRFCRHLAATSSGTLFHGRVDVFRDLKRKWEGVVSEIGFEERKERAGKGEGECCGKGGMGFVSCGLFFG